MSRLRQVVFVPLLALGAALLPPAAVSPVVGQGLVATVNIASDGNSGIAGTATLTELSGGRMAVELRLSGAGGTPRPAHFHLGSCNALDIQAPSIPLQPAVNGASTSQVEATFQQLLSRAYAIHVHRSAEELGVYVASGDVQAPRPPGAPQGQSATVEVRSDGNSGIAGTAVLTELSAGRMAVELRLAGAGGTPRPAHFHLGSCDALDIQAPSIPLQPVVNGVSTSQVEATFQQLQSRPYAIHVHRSAEELGVYVACGDVQAPPAPAPQGQSATVEVRSDGDSGITGTTTLTELSGGRMAVELRLAGAGATPRPAHFHLGSCDALDIQAPSIPLQPAVNGASTSQVEATFQQLLSRAYAIHVHRSAEELGVYVACRRHRLARASGAPAAPGPRRGRARAAGDSVHRRAGRQSVAHRSARVRGSDAVAPNLPGEPGPHREPQRGQRRLGAPHPPLAAAAAPLLRSARSATGAPARSAPATWGRGALPGAPVAGSLAAPRTRMPQAMRSPELPVGSVTWSSAAAWMIRAEPSASKSEAGPGSRVTRALVAV